MKKANIVLENNYRYMCSNSLILNKEKTKYIIFEPKSKPKAKFDNDLKIRETKIERVYEAKFLGVWLDSKLSFVKQYDTLRRKLIKATNALICTKNVLNYKSKLLFYHSHFKSHLDYCAITYFDKLNQAQINKLFKLQKQSIRLIFNAKKKVHTNKLFQLAELIPLPLLYETESIKFAYNYMGEMQRPNQPKALRELIVRQNVGQTRMSNDLTLLKTDSKSTNDQAIYNIIKKWNSASGWLRNAGNPWILNIMIKEYYIDNLEKCETHKCFMCKLDENWNYEIYMNK